MTARIRCLPLVAVAALVLTVSACGGGGGGPVTNGGDMTPGDGEMPGDGDGMMPGDGDGTMSGDGDGMMPGDGDGMMPGDDNGMMPVPEVVPDPQALANAIDLVANDSRQDANGEYIGGWWWRRADFGEGPRTAVTRTRSGGGYVDALVSHNDDGELQHNVSVWPIDPLRQADPLITAGQNINTLEDSDELEGVARTARSVSDHDLGADWQVTELAASYDNGGTLEIYVATDAQPGDGASDPYSTATEAGYNIRLPGVPDLPAGRDFMVVWIADGESIGGSLDGDAGSFSCANAEGCSFIADHSTAEDYFTASTGVSFTPEGGSAQPVAAVEVGSVPRADYLAFGRWLYVPEDATDMDGYDFAVFASGGDPFDVSDLRALTGTASYEGGAAGMYYVNGLSSSPDTGSFTASVELTADFGNSSATGFVNGEVNDFTFEGDVSASLPSSVTLTASPYDEVFEGFGVQSGTTNIFDSAWSDETAALPGGWVGGAAQAHVNGENWYGTWSGVFYGNGAAPTDRPTSVAGEFGISMWNDNERSGTGLTGAFGAHRQ